MSLSGERRVQCDLSQDMAPPGPPGLPASRVDSVIPTVYKYIYIYIHIVFSMPYRDSTGDHLEHSHDNELSGVRISFHHQKQCGSGQPMVRALG